MTTVALTGGRYVIYPSGDSGKYYTYRAWGQFDYTEYGDRIDYTITCYLTIAKTNKAVYGPGFHGNYTVTVSCDTHTYDYTANIPGYAPSSSSGDRYTIIQHSGSIPKTTYDFTAQVSLDYHDVSLVYPQVYSISGSSSFAGALLNVSARDHYTVNYASNGGSSTPASQTKWMNWDLTLAGAISRTGYRFNGWKASNGSVYSASGSYTANAGTTLTAQWNANTYTVVYNGNGNTGGSTASSSHTYNVSKNLTTNGFTKTDCLFKGWATSQNGPVVYSDGQSVANLTATHGATVDLYAVWEYAYTDPNILTLSVERVDGSRALDDTGTNAKVTITANPAGKKTIAGGSASPINTRIQIYYKRSISDASEQNMLALTSYDTINTDGASSTQYIDATSTGKTGFAIGTDEQCDILVVAQGIDDNAVKCTTQRVTLVQTAKFIIDFNDDSQYDSVGIFGVAPDFNDIVYVNGDILIEVDSNSGTDELYRAICELGWDDDVLVN